MWSYKWFHGGQQTWFVKNTIQYDSKSTHSKRRQTVNWTWEVACWFFENLGSYVYDSMRARVRFCFWKSSAQRFFVEKLYGMRARALGAVHALARARGAARDGSCSPALGGSAAKWTNVVWPIKSRQTNKPINQQTNTHYSFIGIDELTKVGSDQRSSTIQYDSKSKHSKRRQTVNWTWEVACWFSFSLFFENLGSYVYDSMRARVRFCFWKASAQRFFRWEVVRHARGCSRCACLPARVRWTARDGSCSLGHSDAALQSGQMSCGR